MGWIPNWLRRADVRLQPRAGAQVDLQPLSERSGRWLKANLFRFPGAVWSRKRGCVELSEGDVIALHLVVERITEAGLNVRLSGRLAAGTVRRLFGLCWCASVSGPSRIARRRRTAWGQNGRLGGARDVRFIWETELHRPCSARQLRVKAGLPACDSGHQGG
jgi:hypothetical protein